MTAPAKLLVSACLMGQAVRYDGKAKPFAHAALARWQDEGRLVVICPERSAGMPVPRPAAEIAEGLDGDAVLAGRAHVLEASGGDVTGAFIEGARNAVTLALAQGCRYALLIDGSPSCGSGFIYDGSFSGLRKQGSGVAAAALVKAGLTVFAPAEIERLVALMDG